MIQNTKQAGPYVQLVLDGIYSYQAGCEGCFFNDFRLANPPDILDGVIPCNSCEAIFLLTGWREREVPFTFPHPRKAAATATEVYYIKQ